MSRIYVADNMLISRPTPRRFLIGLATQIGEPVCVTPKIVDQAQTSVARIESQNIMARLDDKGIEYKDRLGELIQGVEGAVRQWINEEFLSSSGPIRCIGQDPDTHGASVELARRIPVDLFKEKDETKLENDLIIVSEAIAAGADLVITNNMNSINHPDLNRWIIENGLRNSQLVQPPALALPRLVGRQLDEFCHRAAINMTLSKTPRSPEAEMESFDWFVENLYEQLAYCSNTIVIEERNSEMRDQRWKEGRDRIAEVEWQQARGVEDSRLAKVRGVARDFDLEI